MFDIQALTVDMPLEAVGANQTQERRSPSKGHMLAQTCPIFFNYTCDSHPADVWFKLKSKLNHKTSLKAWV